MSLACGCELEPHLEILPDDKLKNMSGKQLRGFANSHNISATGESGEGFSRWRNTATATELTTALAAHRDKTYIQGVPGSGVPGIEKLPQLLTNLEDLLGTVHPESVYAMVCEQVESEVSKYRKIVQQIEFKVGDIITKAGDIHHKNFPDLIKLLAARVHVMLVGPAGSGKTEAAIAAAKVLKLETEIISVGPQTMQSELAGYRNATGEYISSAVRRAFEGGKLLIIDEMDAGNAGVFTFINSTLANTIAGYPDGPAHRHDNFAVIACANTFGSGADMVYIGRSQLDGATLDRYVSLVWDYDEEFEMELALRHNPDSRHWVKRVQGYRKNMLENKIRHIIGPRASINGAKLLKAGFTVEQLEPMLIFKGLNEENCDKIRNPKGK